MDGNSNFTLLATICSRNLNWIIQYLLGFVYREFLICFTQQNWSCFAQVSVSIKDSNGEVPQGSLVVQGYKLSGTVLGEGSSSTGAAGAVVVISVVHFRLFTFPSSCPFLSTRSIKNRPTARVVRYAIYLSTKCPLSYWSFYTASVCLFHSNSYITFLVSII